MSKAPKIADVAETLYPAFDTSKTVDQLRTFAEKGIEQSKDAYAKLKAGAEEAQKTIESTYETVKSASTELSFKTLKVMRSNTDAGFSHLEALLGAKSISEIMELQTGFIRKQFELGVEQAKEMQTIATKAADDVSKPAKAAFEKVMSELKAA